MRKRTKIIATIGPAASSSTIIAGLIRAGMDAARLNFSHGDWNDHTRRIRLIRQESEKARKQIAIIQDSQDDVTDVLDRDPAHALAPVTQRPAETEAERK